MRSTGRAPVVAIIVFTLGCLLAAEPAPAAMKVVAVTTPLPTDGETQPLKGLTYGGDEWMVEITAIRYEVSSPDGGDPVLSGWTVTATSSRPATQKVILMVTLQDQKGKRLGGTTKTLFVKFGEGTQNFTFDMKADREAWERAKSLRVQATFAVR